LPRDPRIHISRAKGPRLATYTVIAPIAPLTRKAGRRAALETQLLYGHHFDVYEIKKGWAWGQAKTPVQGSKQKGYVGFVSQKCLADTKMTPSHIVTALKAPIFTAPDIKSHIIQSLPLGASIKAQGTEAAFVQIGAGGYVHLNHLRKQTTRAKGFDYVDIAEAHLGLPYIWGGISSDGLDCSGLVLSSLRAAGQDAPRDTDMMEVSLGRPLPISQRGLKRGDLIFWQGHVGIMQTSGRILHANAFYMKVASEPLREAVARIAASGGGPITAIKRLY